MWIHSDVPQKWLEGLPLFSYTNPWVIIKDETGNKLTYILNREDTGVISCSWCGKKIDFSEGFWFCPVCKKATNQFWESQDFESEYIWWEIIAFSPKKLITPYKNEGENIGNITVYWIEKYTDFNIAIMEITHRFPGKKYIHKGRKLWPDGKRSGETTRVEKISSGKNEKKFYRVQYDPQNLLENVNIFVFSWKHRDGKQRFLDQESIKQALKELHETVLQ